MAETHNAILLVNEDGSLTEYGNTSGNGIPKQHSQISVDSTATVGYTPVTKTVTVNAGDGVLSAVSSDTSVCTVSLEGNVVTITGVAHGEAIVTVTISETANYYGANASIVVTNTMAKIVSFANGTDEEINAMLDAYYNDNITWEQMGWNIGDTRLMHFNEMDAPSPQASGSKWAAQDIVTVIVAHDLEDLAEPINGHTKACITRHVREVLNNNTNAGDQNGHIYVNGDSSLDMTFTKWANLYMRTYLNSTVFDAISSSALKSAIKPTKHYRHTNYNTADDEQVIDTLFVPSYPNIYGTESYTYYTPTTHTEGTQWPYYQTSSNRIKYGNNNGVSNGVAQHWWNGSASSYYNSGGGYLWCLVSASGSSSANYGNAAYALAPAFSM